MKRFTLLAAGVLILFTASTSLAQGFPRNGYLGLFGDAAGTQCCVNAASGTGGTLYFIAITAGATAGGITGAEFRVEVTANSGGLILQGFAAAAGSTTLGAPFDLDPTTSNLSGMNVVFAECHGTAAGDHILLGSVPFFNFGATPTDFLVKRRQDPSNLVNADCPLFTLCNFPEFTAVCMTLQTSESTTEPIAFVTSFNQPTCTTATCGYVGVEPSSWEAVKKLYR